MSERDYGDYRYCFACGADNPIGLRVTAQYRDGVSELSWTPRREYEGYQGVLHGGIIATLLDEAMAYAAISLVGSCATAEMQTRYRQPVSSTQSLRLEGRVIAHKGRVVTTEADLIQDGALKATATGKFVIVSRTGRPRRA